MVANKLNLFLSWYYVYLLEFNFFLLITAFIFSFKHIKRIFSEIQNKHLLLLILLAILGILSTSFLAPRTHRIFYDEDIYNSIAQNIAHQKRAVMCNEGYYENGELQIIEKEYNKQPPAYPYLISIMFRTFGTNELFTFIFNNIIFGLTIIVIFLISFLLFKDIFASFMACLAYIVIPVNLQWFNTCAAEPSTVFFTSLAIFSSLLYLREKKPSNLLFFITCLAFSLNFRSESFLVAPLVLLIFLIKEPSVFKRKEIYTFGILFLFLSTAIVLHLYSARGMSWGAEHGPKISLEYLRRGNLLTNVTFYLNNRYFPIIFSIFAILGIPYKFKEKFKEKLILLSWFLIFWGIFLFFYAGSYMFSDGLSIRFSLLSYVPLAIFTGLGITSLGNFLEKKIKPIKTILILFIVFNSSWFLPFINSKTKGEGELCRMDREYAMEFIKLLPSHSIIYTHNPNMFLINKQSAVQTSAETYQPGIIKHHLSRFKGGVYVHYNYWSDVPYDDLQRQFTANILERYDYNIIKEYYYKNHKYGLYKIIGPKER
jgi:hypothetical protein